MWNTVAQHATRRTPAVASRPEKALCDCFGADDRQSATMAICALLYIRCQKSQTLWRLWGPGSPLRSCPAELLLVADTDLMAMHLFPSGTMLEMLHMVIYQPLETDGPCVQQTGPCVASHGPGPPNRRFLRVASDVTISNIIHRQLIPSRPEHLSVKDQVLT